MTSLLAILLVCNSTRGHHFVLSYPPDPQRPLADRYSSQSYPLNSNVDKAGSDKGDTSGPSPESKDTDRALHDNNDSTRLPPNASKAPPRRKSTTVDEQNNNAARDAFAGRDSIFNIDVSFLADALTPKPPLCDQRFQLSIDDLTFVGHPVSLPTSSEETSLGLGHSRTSSFNNDDMQITTENDNKTLPSSPPGLSPTATSTTSPSLASVMSRRRRSETLAEERDGASSMHVSSRVSSSENGISTSTHMTHFHVVFVMSPPDLELNAQTDDMYNHVVRRYASALQYEQIRCGYVLDEIEKVLMIKEEALNNGTPYDQVMNDILLQSSLARDIKQIYTAISTNNITHIIVNDFIDLSLQIPILGSSSSYGCANSSALSLARNPGYHYASLVDIYGIGGYEYENYPVICPYHTLLLLEDPEEVLKNMPLDASPTLVQLVQVLTPAQSLQELHLLLDCSLAQIYRLAAHLIYWRKARLIHTIHARNIYVVSPQANLDDLASLNADFNLHIPNLDLPTLLSQLSIAKPLHAIAPRDLRNQYLEAITYLLRKDLVVQLHMFLVLVIHNDLGPETTDDVDGTHRRSSNLSSSSFAAQPSGTSPPQSETMSTSPGHSSMVDVQRRVKRLAHDKAPKEIAELFERLAPYMDGKYHIEEIMYRQGVSRKQLGLVLKYYKDNIITVYHY